MVFSSLFYDDFKVFQPRLWRFYEVENLEGFDPTSSSTCRENGTESHNILGKIPVDGPFQPKCSWNIIGTCRFFFTMAQCDVGVYSPVSHCRCCNFIASQETCTCQTCQDPTRQTHHACKRPIADRHGISIAIPEVNATWS